MPPSPTGNPAGAGLEPGPSDEQPLTVLEALHSTPARRYLSPDPIPDDVLWAILDAAIRGPSGGNAQRWGWVVVTDQEVKDRVAAWYRDNWNAAYGSRREQILSGAADASSPRVGSSIYGAVQQLCLAARAYGIGTSLTTLYTGHEEELRELLGLPPDALTMALIPMGYPARGRWAEPRRQPVEEVVHWGRWDVKRSRP